MSEADARAEAARMNAEADARATDPEPLPPRDKPAVPASPLPVEAARGAEPSEAEKREAFLAQWHVIEWRWGSLRLKRTNGWTFLGPDGITADTFTAAVDEAMRRAPSPATTTGDQTPAEEQRG